MVEGLRLCMDAPRASRRFRGPHHATGCRGERFTERQIVQARSNRRAVLIQDDKGPSGQRDCAARFLDRLGRACLLVQLGADDVRHGRAQAVELPIDPRQSEPPLAIQHVTGKQAEGNDDRQRVPNGQARAQGERRHRHHGTSGSPVSW